MRIREPRGSALVMALVVVLVITAAGVAVVRFSSREVAGAYAARKEATINACAEAARALLMSQWKLLGTAAGSVPPVNIPFESTGSNTTVQGGHYGQNPSSALYWNASSQTWVNNIQVIPLNPLTVGANYQVNDITNRVADQAQPYRVVAHCTQSSGEAGSARETEVEFAVQWGL